MGRQQFSAPEESTREKRRKAILQVEYTLLGAFVGASIATANLSYIVMVLFAIIIGVLPFLTNRYWDQIHAKLLSGVAFLGDVREKMR